MSADPRQSAANERPTADIAGETGRVEAFSDGVFAIAITLLILDIRVPGGLPAGQLAAALAHLWPAYLAFLTSFFTIGVMWMNHHRIFNLVGKSDQGLLALNTMLLLGVTVVPFPTSLLAEYLGRPGERLAAIIYNATFLFLAIAFSLLWRHALGRHRLIPANADREAIAAITHRYKYGPLLYAGLVVVAIFSGWMSLALNLLLAIYFAMPSRRFVNY